MNAPLPTFPSRRDDAFPFQERVVELSAEIERLKLELRQAHPTYARAHA